VSSDKLSASQTNTQHNTTQQNKTQRNSSQDKKRYCAQRPISRGFRRYRGQKQGKIRQMMIDSGFCAIDPSQKATCFFEYTGQFLCEKSLDQAIELINRRGEVSERSERALMKTRIRATTKLTLFSIFWLAHAPPPCFIKNAHNLASLGAALAIFGRGRSKQRGRGEGSQAG